MEASELSLILEQHKLWIETKGKQGTRANLGHADLTGANLYGAYLGFAYLSFANLRDANLGGAILEYADLEFANLYRANLRDANLEGAHLRDAYFYRANLTGVDLTGANLTGADLRDANLRDANLRGASLNRANLSGAIGLPDISWIIPGCLAQLNQISYSFYLEKERKHENFIQDSFGFIIQNNPEEKTFDMLVEDRIIIGIPDWVKYSGLKQAATESV